MTSEYRLSRRSRAITALILGFFAAHFIPLAPVLRDRGLVTLGALTCAVAAVALVVALATDIRASAITGVGAGSVFLAYALYSLVRIRGTI